MLTDERCPSPILSEFQRWPSRDVQKLAQGKAVVLAPGGTSRWYFLEYGESQIGYAHDERFREYGRRVIQRVVEIADMLFRDGVQTVFVMSWGVGQTVRGPEYLRNMTWAYEMLADEVSEELYTQHGIGVLFRGQWAKLFERFESLDLTHQYRSLEESTTRQRDRWLIWYIDDDLIPQRVLSQVLQSLQEKGEMPDRQTLCEAYYGRSVDTIDIFIANNKPNISDMTPPLTSVHDQYFTISPSLYMDQPLWRHILYDHLFSRKRLHRDWTSLQPEAVEEMRSFYKASRGAALGLGSYHPPSQTWRPLSWSG